MSDKGQQSIIQGKKIVWYTVISSSNFDEAFILIPPVFMKR